MNHLMYSSCPSTFPIMGVEAVRMKVDHLSLGVFLKANVGVAASGNGPLEAVKVLVHHVCRKESDAAIGGHCKLSHCLQYMYNASLFVMC